jgi:hypothetical protein
MNFNYIYLNTLIIIILLISIEIFSRIFLWESQNSANENIMGSNTRNFSMNNFGDWYPNTNSIWLDNKDFPFNVKINSDGFRKNTNLSNDLKNILVLGDSFAFGLNISNQDIWTSLVERKFQKNNYKYELLNNGIPGTTIKDHEDFLIEKINEYNFEHVLLVIYSNDLQDLKNGLEKDFFVRANMKIYEKDVDEFFTIDHIKYLLDKYLASYSVIRNIKNNLIKKQNDNLFEYECGRAMFSDKYIDDYLKILKNIKNLLHNKDISLSIVYIPGVFELNYFDNFEFRIKLIDKVENLKIPYLNFYPILKKKNLSEVYLLDPIYNGEDLNDFLCENKEYKSDIHMSRYGHIIISNFIYNFMKKNLDDLF